MALQQLSPEQIRDWSREQKDRWWLANVFRGDMPQLTLRSALTGFLLGGLLSVTNLYVGAKTGWTLGVGLTSVILAFAIYRVFSRLGARDMTILENNCVQSIATAAGYMTMPLTSGLAAYMWATNNVLPVWQILVLHDRAVDPRRAGRVSDEAALHQRRAASVSRGPGLRRRAGRAVREVRRRGRHVQGASALAAAAAARGRRSSLISGENYMRLLQERWLGFQSSWHLPHAPGRLVLLARRQGLAPLPKLAGVDIRQLALSPTIDFAMIGAGGLMGIRTAASLLIGAVLNFVIVVPIMIALGEIMPRAGSIAEGTALFGRAHILNYVGALVGHRHDGGRGDGGSFRPARGVRRGVPQPDRPRAGRATRRRHAAGTSNCRCPSPGSACPIVGAVGRLDGARLVRRGLGARRRRDSADPRACADRREQHRAHRHHALRIAVEDPAVHVRRDRRRARRRRT